jgi:AICAR transformylase/IMP cyclohydrolase PurH
MATVTQTLRMVFRSQAGNNVTIALDNPRDNLTAAEIEAVMDLVIARNVFSSAGGDLVAKQDIRVIDTTTNDLYDPPA